MKTSKFAFMINLPLIPPFNFLFLIYFFVFSPVVARWNVWAFIVLRVFQGMFEGVTFPALHAMIARWVPLEERNSFMSRSFMGSVFGLVITFPLCGYMRLLENKV